MKKQLEKLANYVVAATNKEQHFGLFLGIAEYSHDPLQIGRVKVRVPLFHGDASVTPTNQLPWGLKNEASGGGFDFGSFTSVHPGSSLWILFENGNPDRPVIIGTNNSIPKKRGIFGTNEPEYLPIDEQDSSMQIWKGQEVALDDEDVQRGMPTQPQETRQTSFHEPTVTVPFKSWKGASITIEDKDAREKFEILDRSGQGIQFKSRISKELNKNNRMQRGLRSVFRGDQFSYSDHTDNRESSFSIRDLGQQGIQSEARKYAEVVKIVSKAFNKYEDGLDDFDYGEDLHTIELDSGHRRTIIEGKKHGKSMFRMSFDAQLGILNLETTNSIKISSEKVYIDAPDITIKGDVMIDGDILVSGDSTIIGSSTTGSPERDKPITYK